MIVQRSTNSARYSPQTLTLEKKQRKAYIRDTWCCFINLMMQRKLQKATARERQLVFDH